MRKVADIDDGGRQSFGIVAPKFGVAGNRPGNQRGLGARLGLQAFADARLLHQHVRNRWNHGEHEGCKQSHAQRRAGESGDGVRHQRNTD